MKQQTNQEMIKKNMWGLRCESGYIPKNNIKT